MLTTNLPSTCIRSSARKRRYQKNLFFSPSSIATALAMVYTGARGPTAEEMAKTLHLTMPQQDVAPAFQSLLATLPGANHRGCQLTMANTLWGQRGYGFTDTYLETIRKQFGGGLTEVDFAQPNSVCQAINTWANKETDGYISKVIGPEHINDTLRFVLTNAIYFKGRWSDKFEKSVTWKAAFLGGDKVIEVPMMSQVTSCRYGLADDIQILEKTYRGRDITMMILLPERYLDALANLEQILSAEKVEQWSSRLRRAPGGSAFTPIQTGNELRSRRIAPRNGYVKGISAGEGRSLRDQWRQDAAVARLGRASGIDLRG